VVNVIEDRAERLDALRGAFALAEELLVVSAMIAHPDAVQGIPYGDGILTRRNTFQKYYRQEELRDWIADALDVEPLPVGPGIFYVFKDQAAEQRFLLGRQENRRTVLRLARLSRPEKAPRIGKAEAKYQEHRALLERLWETALALGRDPDRSEVPEAEAVAEHFGTAAAALRFVKARKENAEAILDQARAARIDDLRVYFAEGQFQRRPPYRHLEAGLQRDIKAFFGDYRAAQDAGRQLLFAAGQVETLAAACRDAAERGLGWLEEGQSLQLPTRLVAELPPVLRVYVACGLRLFGDPESADLLKIHIGSGKLTLMSFDDFEGKPLPKLLRRVKLKLRTQDFDLFEYGDTHPPPYLYRKSRYLNEEFPHYAEQREFDERLDELGLLDLEGYGPPAAGFDARLDAARYAVDGFRLVRSRTIPDLDAPCGQHFRYRDLIHCGETQARTGLANLPQQPETYTALRDLAAHVLDPVIDYFGLIRLTYGFCSRELAKDIKHRIALELDQHAGHERKRTGQPICPRLGAAVDFIVEDEDMAEVARWIIANLPFDRLYFYGQDRPVHVSWSETPAGEAWEMRETGGRRVPRRFG
jgi:DNA phosphorothioation-associated putative methyltransferase